MALSVGDAYGQIKALENTGKLVLPEPQETVVVGTIDPKSGGFTWSVPTLNQDVTTPPPPASVGPGPKTNTVTTTTMGVVFTKAVDLRLQFQIIPQKPIIENLAFARPATAQTILGAGDSVVAGTNGGVTITSTDPMYPVVSSGPDHIVIDVGLACSKYMEEWVNTTPPLSSIGVTINIPGHPPQSVSFFVLRPPVLGMGAFTIPTLPMTIVYAPPQGKLLKNTATYSDAMTLTRTITSSITTSKNTKTAQAYSIADLIGKVAGAITAVAGIVATGGSGAVAGASVVGALQMLGTALTGGAQAATGATADASKQLSGELSLVSSILNAVDSSSGSTAGTVTVENDHSLSLAITNMSQYGAEAALGPGAGDRIIYMSNVKVVWVAVNGDVGIHVLGFEAIGANSVNDLLQERAWLAAGNKARLGLDATAIASLLSMDPLVPTSRPTIPHPEPAVIRAPRFVPADPPGRKGTGSSSSGDQFTVTVDTTLDDKQTATSSQTTITDAKPGWAAVLFGADNVDATTTTTFTSTRSSDVKSEDKVTSTITMFTADVSDGYDIKIFHDLTFGTFLILNSDSPLLKGVTISTSAVGTAAGSSSAVRQ